MNEVRFEFGFHGWLEFWTGVANEWEIHIPEAEIVGYVTHIISEDWRNLFGKDEGFGFKCPWCARFEVWLSSRHLEIAANTEGWDWVQILRFGVVWLRRRNLSTRYFVSFHCVPDNSVVGRVSWSLTNKEPTLWRALEDAPGRRGATVTHEIFFFFWRSQNKRRPPRV